MIVRCASWLARLPAKLIVAVIRLYQLTLSRLIGPCCRFRPTCSQYAIQAINKHGVVKGLGLAAWRIARCHPWSRGGYDPP